ncbi:MAG TPA: nucleotidyltransferase domain-containing protein [Candidatus Hydrogenedentes bacterium]|nr:nucleotidyltransferase domain-containing protein [Candidatus Hydrogenedentota bacterium]
MALDEQLLKEIVRRILDVASPERIILFGSASKGEMTSDSDIDLLIVEPEIHNRQEEYARIRRALGDLEYPFDIILITSQWFEESKEVIGGIAYPANKQGQTLYAA